MIRKVLDRAIVVLGLLAIGVALATLVAGDQFIPAAIQARIRTVPPTVVIGVVTWFGVMLWLDRARRRSPASITPLSDDWPEEPTQVTDTAPTVGADWESLIEGATSSEITRENRVGARDRIESDLREQAIELYALAHDVETDAARNAIEAGTWTDDSRATGLLGGPEAPSPPLHVRVLDLLRPGSAYLRQIRHTIRALQALAGTEGNG